MSDLERRLAEFVDRTAEMECFCELLQSDYKPIMVVWGESGVGKSLLLARMMHECVQRGIPKAEIVWNSTRNHDYLSIMCKICADVDVGLEFFGPFTDLVNYFTVTKYELKVSVQGGVGVAQAAQMTNVRIGDMAGVVIKDSMFVLPRIDMAVTEQERMTRLTDRFIECFAAALRQQMRVMFLDATEKMTQDTQNWVIGELLRAALDGRLPNVRFVLCGERPPPFEAEMRRYVEEAELRPLELEYIVEYLAKRGVGEALRVPLAQALVAYPNVVMIATAVDSYLERSGKLR